MGKFRKIIIYICIMIILQFSIAGRTEAVSNYVLDGWEYMEGQKKTQLWQKKDQDFISENIINISVAVGGIALEGYILRLGDDIENSLISKDKMLEIWKLIYTGFDGSGNIYFELFTEKEKIDRNKQLMIAGEIKKLAVGNESPLLNRINFFSKNLKDLLKDKGEQIVVNPGKKIILKGVDHIPAISIETLPNTSIINISVTRLEF